MHIHLFQFTWNLRGRYAGLELHTVSDPQAACLLLQHTFHRAVTNEDRVAVVRQIGQGLDDQREPLFFFEAPKKSQRKGIVSFASRPGRAAAVDVGIEAELGDDMNGTSVAFALEYIGGIAIAGLRG